MSMVINGTSGITFPDGSLQGIGVGRRNLIINGAMQVAQRGTSATGQTSSGYYTCDRFRSSTNAEQTETHEQSTDAPDGFSSSYKVTVTTADASLETNDYATIAQIIEAQNLQHLQYGTSDAKQLTVSFWVKSSATGTYAVAIYNYDSNSYISNSYTISSANTWEYKTLTFDGDISGSINNDNEAGLEVYFIYSAGSDWTGGTPNTWGTSANFAVGQTVNLVSTLNSTFQITGVQLEVGSVATPFEHRSYGEELALCQRYYALIANSSSSGEFGFASGFQTSTGGAVVQVQTPVPMRAAPTATASNLGISNQVNFTQAATLAYSGLTNSGGLLGFTYSSAGAQYSPCLLVSQSTLIGNLSFSSEL
jgi:hypothetical protein